MAEPGPRTNHFFKDFICFIGARLVSEVYFALLAIGNNYCLGFVLDLYYIAEAGASTNQFLNNSKCFLTKEIDYIQSLSPT